ncbi:AAA family ATPase [Pelagirhabdus alkalitolerans]
MTESNQKIQQVLENIERVIIGKDDVVNLSLTALLARGHVLLEDVPGVGKTMLVRTLSKSLGCEFNRIQFTPDLLPSDVTGVSIYHPQKQTFEYRKGPIVGDIILADEINRTSPKTQSALLEAMEESKVTVDGETVTIDQPFLVMATQNPVEYEGTYPLPEAQLDRFMIKLKMGYPTEDEELMMLGVTKSTHPIETLASVMNRDDVKMMQKEVDTVHIEESVQQYIVKLVRKTREDKRVRLGVSPRGAISLMRAAKAYAYIKGRDYVLPDDVIYLANFVLSHRLMLGHEAKYQSVQPEAIIQSAIESIDVPTRKGL